MSDSTQPKTKPKQSLSQFRNGKRPTYNNGDRVAERPISRIAVTSDRNLLNKFGKQRFGTVVGHRYKVNKRGSREPFLIIKWDHLEQPCEHAQQRICHVDKLEELRTGAFHAIG